MVVVKRTFLIFVLLFSCGPSFSDIDDYPQVKSFLNLDHHFDYVNVMQLCAGLYQHFPELSSVSTPLRDLAYKIREENYKKMKRAERKDADDRSNAVLTEYKKMFKQKDVAAISKIYDACGLRYIVR